MAIKIGTISISLTAETSSFSKDMQKASDIALNSSKNIERSFKLMAGAITAATGAAAGAMGTFVYKTQSMLFNMRKMAEYAGTSIQNYSKLAYAAKMAGMPAERLAETMARLAHNYMIAAGGSLEQASAFKALGINLHTTNGAMMDTTDLFIKVAKALDKYKDSANKTGVETLIMGRSGAQASLLMKMLANDFGKLSAQAKKLGVVFTEETIQKAQALHDSWVTLEAATEGLSVRLLDSLSPAMDTISHQIVDFLESTKGKQDLELFGEDMAKGLKLASDAFTLLEEHATAVKLTLEGLVAIRALNFFAPMAASAGSTKDFVEKLSVALLNLSGRLMGFKKLGGVFIPFAKNAAKYAKTVKDLAREENVAQAAALAWADGVKAVNSAFAAGKTAAILASTSTAVATVAAGVLDVYEETHALIGLDHDLKQMGLTWTDYWKAGIDQVIGSTHNLKDLLTSIIQNPNGVGIALGFTDADIQLAKEAKKNVPHSGKDLLGGKALNQFADGLSTKTGKKNMPGIGITDPQAAVMKSIGMMSEQARYTQEKIKLLNASPQQKRNAAIQDAFKKWVVKETPTLEKLSRAQREADKGAAFFAISIGEDAKAALKYDTGLQKLNFTLDDSIAKHEAMANAIGKSAKAMQDAMVAAEVNQKMESMYGHYWKDNPTAVAASKYTAARIRTNLSKQNAQDDKSSLTQLEQEVAAQRRLFNMIGRGSAAIQHMQMQNALNKVRADFASRGDTNHKALAKELELTKQNMQMQFAASDRKRATTFDYAYQYQQQVKSLDAAVTAAKKYGIAIDYTAVLAADKEAWLKFANAQDQAILSTGNMLQGLHVALNQMARDTVSNAKIMHDALTHAVGSVNSALSTSLVAHAYTRREYVQNIANSLSHAGRGIASNMMNSALKKGESGMLQAFGLGKMGVGKPDGSSQNPWYVRLVNQAHGGTSALMHPLDKVFKGAHSKALTSTEHAIGHVFGGAGHAVSSVVGKVLGFLPHFAAGGSVVPGMPSIVGERGPELFVPPSAGRIIPNSALNGAGSSSPVINVDARGSNDPAATEAAIHRAFRQYTPHIAAIAVAAQKDHSRRVPSMHR